MAVKSVINVAILHFYNLYREGIKTLLDQDKTLKVVYNGGLDLNSLKTVVKNKIDVLIFPLDVSLIMFDVIIEFIRENNRNMFILAIANPNQEERIISALKAGLHGYVLTTANGEALIKAIKFIANGQIWTERSLMGPLLKEFHSDSSFVFHLSKRQREIALLLAEGKSDKEIALQLKISFPTLRSHLNSIYKRLGANSRLQAVCHLLKRE
jgi:DNA-binding NarL/FixJ family response regulator